MDPRTRSRTGDPETSKLAAESVNFTKGQLAVLDIFHGNGAMTDLEVCRAARSIGLKLSDSGLRTRRSELVALGFLRDSGDRAKLPSGRMSIVWEPVPEREEEAEGLLPFGP